MSERMTADEMARLGRAAYPEWTNKDKATLWQEADRARAEEARLLGVVKKQEERIVTLEGMLATTLKDLRGRMGHRLLTPDGQWCACEDCTRRVAALKAVSP